MIKQSLQSSVFLTPKIRALRASETSVLIPNSTESNIEDESNIVLQAVRPKLNRALLKWLKTVFLNFE